MFETFNEFVEIKKVLAPHLKILIEAALKISANKEYSINLRESTLFFLELISVKYGNYLIKKGGLSIIDKIIEVGFTIASERMDSSMEIEYGSETGNLLNILNIQSITFYYSIKYGIVYDIELFIFSSL